jgi:hypothetical protein
MKTIAAVLSTLSLAGLASAPLAEASNVPCARGYHKVVKLFGRRGHTRVAFCVRNRHVSVQKMAPYQRG